MAARRDWKDADLDEVVRRAVAGDADAWESLVGEFTGILRWVCHRHGLEESDAADVMQETWLVCLQRLGELRDPLCLPAWLLTTCRRTCLVHLRHRRRCVPQDSNDVLSTIAAVAEPDADPGDVVARQDAATQLYAAIDELPAQQRAVLLALLDIPGGGYLDASVRLGVPLGSVGPTRRRALVRLQRDPRLRVVG